MWKLEYATITDIRHALVAARTKTEETLANGRNFSHFLGRTPELFITYLKDAKPGSFPITSPCIWPKRDWETFFAVLQAAYADYAAQKVYARIMLAAKDPSGCPIFPAGRVDLLLATRTATAIPEEHPARKMPATLKNRSPFLFYDEPDTK